MSIARRVFRAGDLRLDAGAWPLNTTSSRDKKSVNPRNTRVSNRSAVAIDSPSRAVER